MNRHIDPEQAVIDELTFRSYTHQRITNPHVPAERWALIFPNAAVMEERYRETFILKLIECAEELGETFDA